VPVSFVSGLAVYMVSPVTDHSSPRGRRQLISMSCITMATHHWHKICNNNCISICASVLQVLVVVLSSMAVVNCHSRQRCWLHRLRLHVALHH